MPTMTHYIHFGKILLVTKATTFNGLNRFNFSGNIINILLDTYIAI